MCETPKSHQRELVDGFRSSLLTALTDFLNPTNGSWWIVQIRPSKQGRPSSYKRDLRFIGLLGEQVGSEQSANFRWWDDQFLKLSLCRLDLNPPPTPVG